MVKRVEYRVYVAKPIGSDRDSNDSCIELDLGMMPPSRILQLAKELNSKNDSECKPSIVLIRNGGEVSISISKDSKYSIVLKEELLRMEFVINERVSLATSKRILIAMEGGRRTRKIGKGKTFLVEIQGDSHEEIEIEVSHYGIGNISLEEIKSIKVRKGFLRRTNEVFIELRRSNRKIKLKFHSKDDLERFVYEVKKILGSKKVKRVFFVL